MNSSKFRFTLDLQKTQSQISIPITLGDTARTWYISFSDGGKPYEIEEGALAKLEIKRPTGTHIIEFCEVENGTTVCYPFSQNENTAAVEGLHECAVILYGADEEILASPRFTMIVTDRVVNSDDINLTDEDKNAIEGIIRKEAGRNAAERERVNAESARVKAEAARVEAEYIRQEGEKARTEAEAKRAEAFEGLKKNVEDAVGGVVSPTVSVETTEDGYKMTVTDKEGKKKYALPAIIKEVGGGSGSGGGTTIIGTTVVANPDEEATGYLKRLKIGDTVYSTNTAYHQAKVFGYEGTEHDFGEKLAELLTLPTGGASGEPYGGEYEVIE